MIVTPGFVLLPAVRSCDPVIPFESGGAAASLDTAVPKLLRYEQSSARSLLLIFDEPVNSEASMLKTVPELEVGGLLVKGKTISILYLEDGEAGVEYLSSLRVRDTSGNSSTVYLDWYGVNNSIPDVVINEFISEGNASHPDIVELYVRSSGNIAGLVLFEGTQSQWKSRLVFPSLRVSGDTYLLVHFKPEGIDAEVDETIDIAASGGRDSADSAWDFWVKDGKGISNTNGVLSLYTNPNGSIMDAVIYSTKSYLAEDKYRGFGRKSVFLQAEELVSEHAWNIAGEQITPEDCVRPQDSTTTRSIARDSASTDTNSKTDWHITPTGGASFGEVNTDERYR